MKCYTVNNTMLLCLRSLKVWMVLRLYGIENLQKYIRNHIKLAEHFEALVCEDPRFEVNSYRTLLVCSCSGPSPMLADIVLFGLSLSDFPSRFLKRVC